ncbi:MAG: bacillolysin, partial [Dermatophilaceae bacterium]|nr:bacillolysin [Dermatophilaceae bacterium]
MSRRTLTWGAAVVASLAIAGVTLPAQGAPSPFDHTATGTVFLPNPVQDLGIETLTDRKDADYAALAPAYHRVTLTDLDGSGTLTG